ncbi:UNVERIFIED_ORG: glycosyltransferase involved in cell wall biosynthesis [Arthrobacter sp. UYCu721]
MPAIGPPISTMPSEVNRLKILMDGRVLASKPSGVRDIAAGMVEGLRQMSLEGSIDFLIAGHDQSFDHNIPQRFFMHAGLPMAAQRLRADRIFIPRQTKPVVSVVPSVPLFHDIGFFRSPREYPHSSNISATTRLAARARFSLAVSQFTADEMSTIGLSTNVHALPIQAIHKLEWIPRQEDKYLLCIAVQEPHKNLVALVKAWNEAEKAGFKLVICGRPGRESQSLQREVAACRDPDSVVVTSGLADDEYLDLLNGCWGYIQPSLYEGLCIPALDLAAAGAPSAVSRSGNLGNVYGRAPENQTFDAHSIPEMIQSIESLLHSKDFRSGAALWNSENIHLTDWKSVAEAAVAGMQ